VYTQVEKSLISHYYLVYLVPMQSMGMAYSGSHSDEVQIQANSQQIIIRTEVFSDQNTVSIRIKDNGSGMPENIKAHIFDHLFTTKEIGLTIQVIWKTSLLFLSSFKERDFEFSPFPPRVGG
jgi:hypothetical protein